MPIIGRVGRRNRGVKSLFLVIHALLLSGAVIIIYPFLVMIAGSFKSEVDFNNLSIMPEYLFDDLVLYHRYLISKYNNMTSTIFYNLKYPHGLVEQVRKSEFVSPKLMADYAEFIQTPPPEVDRFYYSVGMVDEHGVYPLELRRFRTWLKETYGAGETGLKAMNKALETDYNSWNEVRPQSNAYFARRISGSLNPFHKKCLEFKRRSPLWVRNYFDIDGYFAHYLSRSTAAINLADINHALGTSYVSWEDIATPYTLPEENQALADVWLEFVRWELNLAFIKVDERGFQAYRNFLRRRYSDSIAKLNSRHGTAYHDFNDIRPPEVLPTSGVKWVDWNEFISTSAPPESLKITGFGYYYRRFLRGKYKSLEKLNQIYGRGFRRFEQIPMPLTVPEYNLAMKADWLSFIDCVGPLRAGFSRKALTAYRDYIISQYRSDGGGIDLKTLSGDYGRSIKSVSAIAAPRTYPTHAGEVERRHYEMAWNMPEFRDLRELAPTENNRRAWSEFLATRHENINELNRAYGYLYDAWDTIPVPTRQWEWGNCMAHKSELIKEFLWRNYAMVFDTIFVNGHAAVNTFIYCFFAVVIALIVNPMAAYALSRFKPPSSYKLLLILMLTMAFPPMVIGIPRFLLMKNLGLLNTFAALILPGAASGYSIFLLKGFFDNLPRDLFECAILDGASEWRMFWQITMPLSKPILAVIALQTFVLAYGNFMFAFIVCQDRKMWTMMVYLYQLQQHANQAVGFASLLVAAVPTFLIFIFCQNIIIRGIAMPQER